jgi:hypothetical protein
MPNHFHAVVKPMGDMDLDEIWKSWKKFTAFELRNRGVAISPVWFPEGYDRIIRDRDHLGRVVRYIARNPSKAGRRAKDCLFRLRPAWVEEGWTFEMET